MFHLVDPTVFADERYPYVTLSGMGSKLAKSGRVPTEVSDALGYVDGRSLKEEAVYQGYVAEDDSGLLSPTEKGLQAGIVLQERTDDKGHRFTSLLLTSEDASTLVDEMVAFARAHCMTMDVVILASSQASEYRKIIGYEQGRDRYVRLNAPAAHGGSRLMMPDEATVETRSQRRLVEPFDVIRVPLTRRVPRGCQREAVEVDVARGMTWVRRATPAEIGLLLQDQAMQSARYLFYNEYRSLAEHVVSKRATHSIEVIVARNVRMYRFVSDRSVISTRADLTYVPQDKNKPVAYQGLTVHDPRYQDLRADVVVPEARVVASLTPIYHGFAYKIVDLVLTVGSIAVE